MAIITLTRGYETLVDDERALYKAKRELGLENYTNS